MTHSRFLIRLILYGWLLCAAGCTLTRPADSAGVPTPIVVTLAPINTTPQIGITVPAVQSLSAPPTPCATTPNAAATRYAADATIDMTTHSVSATLYTTYRNETGTALSSIIFNVVAAHRPDTFTLTALGAGANSDSYTFADGRLDVNLRQPLLPGCDTTIGLGFTIKVPLITGVTAKNGYFGYTERQLNLGDWLPAVGTTVEPGRLAARRSTLPSWRLGSTALLAGSGRNDGYRSSGLCGWCDRARCESWSRDGGWCRYGHSQQRYDLALYA